MEKKWTNKTSHRLLAVFLILLLVWNVVPFETILTARAAESAADLVTYNYEHEYPQPNHNAEVQVITDVKIPSGYKALYVNKTTYDKWVEKISPSLEGKTWDEVQEYKNWFGEGNVTPFAQTVRTCNITDYTRDDQKLYIVLFKDDVYDSMTGLITATFKKPTAVKSTANYTLKSGPFVYSDKMEFFDVTGALDGNEKVQYSLNGGSSWTDGLPATLNANGTDYSVKLRILCENYNATYDADPTEFGPFSITVNKSDAFTEGTDYTVAPAENAKVQYNPSGVKLIDSVTLASGNKIVADSSKVYKDGSLTPLADKTHESTFTELGTYKFEFHITKEGKETNYDKTVTRTVEYVPADLDATNFPTVVTTPYTYAPGVNHVLVQDNGSMNPLDAVEYAYATKTGESTWSAWSAYSAEKPALSDAGTYKVKIRVTRYKENEHTNADANYKVYEQELGGTVTIGQASLNDLISVSATTENLTYTGLGQNLFSVTGLQAGDSVSVDFGAGYSSVVYADATSLNSFNQTDAGTYTYTVKVSRANYSDYISGPLSTVIAQKAQELKFTDAEFATKENGYETLDCNGTTVIKDFAAGFADASLNNGTITYSFDIVDESGAVDSRVDDTAKAEIASIAADGKLTIKKGGHIIKVTATATATDANFTNAVITYTLAVKNTEDGLISFPSTSVTYTVGSGDASLVPTQTATKADSSFDTATVSYSAKITLGEAPKELAEAGLSINPTTGAIAISDLSKFVTAVASNHEAADIVVTATKPATKVTVTGQAETELFKEASATYTIHASLAAIPAEGVTYKDPTGSVLAGPNGANGWYNTAVTVEAPTGYLISKSVNGTFAGSLVFSDVTDKDNRVIFYQKVDSMNASLGVTQGVSLKAIEKIDTGAPTWGTDTFTYPATTEIDNVEYYNDFIEVTITAYDTGSGVDKIEWTFNRSASAVADNKDILKGEITELHQDATDSSKYTGVLRLPAQAAEQLNGNLEVIAHDKTGNVSVTKTDTEKIIVIDNISPTKTITYEGKAETDTNQIRNNIHYFSGDVLFTMNITEINFFEEDIRLIVEKDGAAMTAPAIEWTHNGKEHVGKFALTAEGKYTVHVKYRDDNKDRSGNAFAEYHSEEIMIDKTAPVIACEYKSFSDEAHAQKFFVTIAEKNFDKADIVVTATVKDINGKEIAAPDIQNYLRTCTWESAEATPDIHTATISKELIDGYYDLTINYKDLALNAATEVKSGTFLVDHTAPATADMSISYSIPVTDKLLSNVSFGYYNPDVKITFTAKDAYAGIDHFTWGYVKENTASTVNVAAYADTVVAAVQDETDKSVFTATVTLPLNVVEQLRGNIAFSATDKYNNTGDKLTDTGHVIVVDTISPTMKVEYNAAQKVVEKKNYYNQAVTSVFTVTEANFYPEDVVFTVTKNQQPVTDIVATWADKSVDEHTATLIIPAKEDHSTDGDYVINMEYKDRSGNAMTSYTSDVIVVDTTAPVVAVTYANTAAVNEMADSQGIVRKYYNSAQTATITITEHNFKAEDIELIMSAANVSGAGLDAKSMTRVSAWVSDGDKHTATVVFPGDANYSFDIAYNDLATNASNDYPINYFTVDTTRPTELQVSYSSHVLEDVLSTITFGFYDAKVTVTVTAKDSTSPINAFKYSYANAENVSRVNAQLLDQMIDAGAITLSDNGGTATAKFEIPRSALGNTEQFNGNINFTATDRAGNESENFQDAKRIVVDNIAPTADVRFETPLESSTEDIRYFNDTISAELVITEANFYVTSAEQANIVKVYEVNPDTKVRTLYSDATVTWADQNVDTHVGRFTIKDDGNYVVEVEYKDKSGNEMTKYTSPTLILDTKIDLPTITINGEDINGADIIGDAVRRSYAGDMNLEIGFTDPNFDKYELSVTRTVRAEKNQEVTQTIIGDGMTADKKGINGAFQTFAQTKDNDGIYTISLKVYDKAEHSSEVSGTFIVNRFGSVYVYEDYVRELIEKDYVQAVSENLVITEFNPNKLAADSAKIEVSRDGRPLENVVATITPNVSEDVTVGESGWYQYTYSIATDNFANDGVYKINISSEDKDSHKLENVAENVENEKNAIVFHVDKTTPEITSITGLEEDVIDATEVTVNYVVFDAIALKSVTVTVDNSKVQEITDFGDDANNYSGSFVISEKSESQDVQIVVEDLAGNKINTSDASFAPAYEFNSSVLVTTNIFVRFYANKILFGSTVGGTVAVAGGGTAAVVLRRRKLKLK